MAKASTVREETGACSAVNQGQHDDDGQHKDYQEASCNKKIKSTLSLEPYVTQKKRHWPIEGQHILAQFDDNTIVVYQAFSPAIADYAVKHQRFGGDFFSFERMSWIKTNFLWMMYRSGWAAKRNQERILAVRITRDGFDQILSQAYTASLQTSKKMTKDDIFVRLQWDPDHCPAGGKQTRRAIQLGLKNQILKMYATEWIVCIEDITTFVKQQHEVFLKFGEEQLCTPSERVYSVRDYSVATRIQLDLHGDQDKQPVVKSGPTSSGTFEQK